MTPAYYVSDIISPSRQAHARRVRPRPDPPLSGQSRGLGVNSFSEGTALSGGEVRVAGGGRSVESLVLVVCLMGVQDSGACPALDRTSVHAEPGRDLGFGEQAVGAEPFAFSGAVTGGVEDAGGLGVGVGVEESVEDGEGLGVGLAGLPRLLWDRDGAGTRMRRTGAAAGLDRGRRVLRQRHERVQRTAATGV
jgi:hypothetical protein